MPGETLPLAPGMKVAPISTSSVPLFNPVDKPTIVVPAEVVEGSEVELRCVVPDNCPEMKPIVSWTNHDDLSESSVYGQVEEESSTWNLITLLKFLPSRENNGRELGCSVTYANTTFIFDDVTTLDVKCELALPSCPPQGHPADVDSGGLQSVS